MTTDEIIEQLDSIVGTYEILVGNGVNSDILGVDDIDAINEAIKLIKAIEDIRAEIKDQMDDDDYFCGLSLALQIIDKHISGKEEE